MTDEIETTDHWPRKTVRWSREKLERFKVEYQQAVERKNSGDKFAEIPFVDGMPGLDVFNFEGNEYLIAYAKYLIEYLDSRLS